MSEDKKTITDALTGGTPNGETTDWKAKYEEARHALESAKVARIAERDERDGARRKRELDERFEREFPGLAAQIGPGGDKYAAWTNYRRYNGPSIDAALAAYDFDALAWHIKKFYTDELGIAPPSGGTAPAAPEPGNIGGGKPVVAQPGKVYTEAEISDLYDEVEKARDRGDFAEVKRIGAEIDKAMREGRVK